MSCYESLKADFELARSHHVPLLGNTHSIQLTRPDMGASNFETHIAWYTRRSLSNPADVLNAIRGLMRSMATKKNAWHQFWGIPITPTDFLKDFERQRVMIAQQIGITFTYGLCWHVSPDDSPTPIIKRRPGFPSWSWVGWIAAVQGPPVDSLEHDFDLNKSYEYFVQKTDGSREILSEDLAVQLFQNLHDVAANYTYILYFTRDVLALRLTYFKDGIDCADNHGLWTHDKTTQSNYAAKVVVGDQNEHYWPLLLTPHVQENDEIHLYLCDGAVECVVLSEAWGLVIYTRNGVSERIGLIRFESQDVRAWRPKGGSLHLRDYFPYSSREILLG